MIYKINPNPNQNKAFTIVELLIVIVVIAILAAITIVAFNGVQQRSRDARRAQDMVTIKKALLNYQAIHGGVQRTYTYGGADGGGWDTSSTTPWLSFLTDHYGGPAPVDPVNNFTGDPGNVATWSGYGYFYHCYYAGSGPLPATANVHMGYWPERSTPRVSLYIPVDACL